MGVATDSLVLVPLCGKSLDLIWLCEQGHRVTGVELSDIAVQAFFAENGIAARRTPLPGFDLYQAGNLSILRGDFFALRPGLIGEVAAVFDRGALISWSPELRQRYAEHLATVTGPDTQTLLVSLEYDQTQMSGPPFSVDQAEIRRLLPAGCDLREVSRHDQLPNEPRFRARGVTRLAEVCYRLSQNA